MGGPHVTFLADEAMDFCDYVVRNEGEETLIELVDYLQGRGDLESILGLTLSGRRRRGGPQPRSSAADLAHRPALARHEPGGGRRRRSVRSRILASRGCPFDCEFCSVVMMFGRTGAHRRAGRGGRSTSSSANRSKIFFYDDNFIITKRRGKELLAQMIEAKLDHALLRPDPGRFHLQGRKVDHELLDLLWSAGCRIVYLGLESANPATLKEYHKESTVEDMAGGLEACTSTASGPTACSCSAPTPTRRSRWRDGRLRRRARAQHRPVPGSDPAARHPADGSVRGRRPHLHPELEPVRRPPRGLLAQADDPLRAAGGRPAGAQALLHGAQMVAPSTRRPYPQAPGPGVSHSPGLGARAARTVTSCASSGTSPRRISRRCRPTAVPSRGTRGRRAVARYACAVLPRRSAEDFVHTLRKAIRDLHRVSCGTRAGRIAWPRSWPLRTRRAAWRRPRPPSTWAWPSRRWATACWWSTWTPRAT